MTGSIHHTVTETSPKIAANEGVLYSDSDYAGLIRRFVIVIVDFAVLFCAEMAFTYLLYYELDPVGDPEVLLLWSWFGFAYVYLVVLKPSAVRTLGYWLTGVRIVDYKEKSPSLIRMTFRLLLWALGPVNPLIDFFWLGGDRHRQAFRDKIVGTYVIKRRASPIGYGKRKAAYYNFMAATFIFWEIQPAEEVSQMEHLL
jgi:hypothetical protein